MKKTVLIAGASGLIGKPLTAFLINKGYTVHQLSRNSGKALPGAKLFKWDVSQMSIDEDCIDNVDYIINLAGEGIADKPWTKKRKEQILKSRTDSLKLLHGLLTSRPNEVKTVISASAVGHFGDRGDEILTEDNEPGTDFLANTCLAWERAADKFALPGIRLVKFRTGVVLTNEGGALPTIAKPIKMGIGAALGNGKQWVPWIHLTDAVSMYVEALENEKIEGVYNMASPYPVTNKELSKAIATQLNKPFWMPSVPALALRILLGEMSRVVLNSNRISADKIMKVGFNFQFPDLKSALSEIYGQ